MYTKNKLRILSKLRNFELAGGSAQDISRFQGVLRDLKGSLDFSLETSRVEIP